MQFLDLPFPASRSFQLCSVTRDNGNTSTEDAKRSWPVSKRKWSDGQPHSDQHDDDEEDED